MSIHIRPRSLGSQALWEVVALPAPWESIAASGAGGAGQHTSPGRAWGLARAAPVTTPLDGSFLSFPRPSLRTALCSPDCQLQPAILEILCFEDFLRFRSISLCALLSAGGLVVTAVAGAYSAPSIILIPSTLIRLLYPPSL